MSWKNKKNKDKYYYNNVKTVKLIFNSIKNNQDKYNYAKTVKIIFNYIKKNITTIIYIYAFSRRFYPKRLTVHSGYTVFISMCVPWELNPQPFVLLTQCSNHWATGTHYTIYTKTEETIFHFVQKIWNKHYYKYAKSVKIICNHVDFRYITRQLWN